MPRLSTTLSLAAAGAGLFAACRILRRHRRYLNPRGKVVLITGGSRGLGLLLARQFSAAGARVVVCARDGEELKRASDEFAGSGRDFVALPCDVTDREQIHKLIDEIVRDMGRLDILINNAGIISVGPLDTMTLRDFELAFKVHVWAPLYATLAVLPHMRRQGGGRIVNISSIGGKIAVPHLLPYDASKFALVGLSEGLRAELMADNIYVTTICPGLMRTGSPRNAFMKGHHRAEYAWFALGDSLPGLSMSAVRAAARIVRATLYGDAQTVLSLPAKLVATFHDLFPELTTDLLGLVNRMLPGPGGIGSAAAYGRYSETRLTRSFLTGLSRSAAVANNELR